MFLSQKLFLIEIGVENVVTFFTKSKNFKLKCDFADIFSFELGDPKQLSIVTPKPLPINNPNNDKKYVEKVKRNRIKNTNRRKKKIKQTPVDESKSLQPKVKMGQSILFGSNIEVLMEKMIQNNLVLNLYDNAEFLIHVGSASIPWNGLFIKYLSTIADCKEFTPVTIKDEYSVFEENSCNLVARVIIDVKLQYFKDNIQTTFREISENTNSKTFLYRGINCKKSSFMCTFKANNKDITTNKEQLESNYVKDIKPVEYASYKNIAAVNFNKIVDTEIKKLSVSDINNISNHIKHIITACNEDLRMLTPRTTIKPMIKASQLDRKYHDEIKTTNLNEVCAIIKTNKDAPGIFYVEQIRGPCGRHDCKIAKHIRAYIQNIIKEDNKELVVSEIIGPCGSVSCTLAEIIREFIYHQGVFKKGGNIEGISSQCSCKEKFNEAFTEKVKNNLESSTDCDDDKSNEDYGFDVFSSESHIGGSKCKIRKDYIKIINNV